MVPQHRRLEMGGGVALRMAVVAAFPRHGPFQGGGQIPPNIRIRPFLDGHRGGGVRNKHVQDPVLPPPSGRDLLQ